MNKEFLKTTFSFVLGISFGIICTRKYFEQMYTTMAAKEMEEFKRYIVKKYESTSNSEEKIEKENLNDQEEKIEYKKKKTTDTNYTEYFKGSIVETVMDISDEEEKVLASKESPTEDSGDIPNTKQKPKIIKAEDSGDLPEYEERTLYFYTVDGILATEYDEVIDDIQGTVGDSLTKYDFINSDETSIYVRNYGLGADYEIIKVNSSFGDSHDL